MEVYLSRTISLFESDRADSPLKAVADRIIAPTQELVLEVCKKNLKDIEGEAIVIVDAYSVSGNPSILGFPNSTHLFMTILSSISDGNDPRKDRRFLRRTCEVLSNDEVSTIHVMPNFDGDNDTSRNAPIIELRISVYLKKSPAKVKVHGNVRVVPGGHVNSTALCQFIREAFREKYD